MGTLRPRSTTVIFALLVAVLLLTGVVVGDSLFLATPDAEATSRPPLAWLAGPPLIALAVTVALALTAPRRLERRRHLTELDGAACTAAFDRVHRLAAVAGLRQPPRLTWDAQAVVAQPLAYGRPGDYRVAVTPALASGARRQPAKFDLVVLHELAHVRNHDVVLAFAALSAWYAVTPLLLAPMVAFVARGSWAMLGEYLVRAGILVAAVGLVRAALLRAREHEADLCAAAWTGSADQAASAFTAYVVRSPLRSLFALHPVPQRRADVIRRPAQFARLRTAESAVVGLLCGAGIWSLVDLFYAAGLPVLTSDRLARVLLFGGAGAYLAAAAVRAANAGSLPRRAALGPAAAGALGVVAGILLSPERTGLDGETGADLRDALLTGGFAFAVVALLSTDLARPRPPRSRAAVTAAVAAGALAGALTAAAVLSTARLLAGGVPVTWRTLPHTASASGAAAALGVLASLISAAVLVRPRAARSLAGPVAWAVGAGVLSAGWAAAIRWRLGGLPDDETTRLYDLTCFWLIVAAATFVAVLVGTVTSRNVTAAHNRTEAAAEGGTPAGIMAGGVTVMVGLVGFIAASRLAGDPWEWGDVASVGKLVAGLWAFVALPVVALAAQLAPKRVPKGNLARVLALVTAVATTGFVVGTVPAVIGTPPVTASADSEMDHYLAQTLPEIATLRDDAFRAAIAYPPTAAERVDQLRGTVLPGYDRAVAKAAQVTGPSHVQQLNDVALDMLRAERAMFAAEADFYTDPEPQLHAALESARKDAKTAQENWQRALTAAQTARTGQVRPSHQPGS